jgi:hypothetical protein
MHMPRYHAAFGINNKPNLLLGLWIGYEFRPAGVTGGPYDMGNRFAIVVDVFHH